jgi:hypothetical protein
MNATSILYDSKHRNGWLYLATSVQFIVVRIVQRVSYVFIIALLKSVYFILLLLYKYY